MAVPTADEVIARSLVEFDDLGFDEAGVQVLINEQVSYLHWITGQSWDPATITPEIEPMARLALVKMVEQEAYQSQPDYVETAADDVVASFSAGDYSETRVDPLKRAAAKLLTANPALAKLLWGLMTPDKNDYWIDFLAATNAPASEVTEIDWSEVMGPYEPLPGMWW